MQFQRVKKLDFKVDKFAEKWRNLHTTHESPLERGYYPSPGADWTYIGDFPSFLNQEQIF